MNRKEKYHLWKNRMEDFEASENTDYGHSNVPTVLYKRLPRNLLLNVNMFTNGRTSTILRKKPSPPYLY